MGYNIGKAIKRASLIVGKQDWGINSVKEMSYEMGKNCISL